jgi:hypothetical protein
LRKHLLVLIAGVLIGVAGARFASRPPRQPDLTALAAPPRVERACDRALGKTAIIIVHGQSNAANYGNTRYNARGAVDNFDPATGNCFAAADPLLGTDGAGGNFATRLGDLLIEAGRYDHVVLVPIAAEGASLAALNGDKAGRIDNAIARLSVAGLTPTHIIFQQGEKDALLTTTSREYVEALHQLVRRFRGAGLTAPFYVSRSTKCDAVAPKNIAAVRDGQFAAVNEALGIRPGPDTDLIGNDGRNPHDGCHMNELGTLANAALWAAFLD